MMDQKETTVVKKVAHQGQKLWEPPAKRKILIIAGLIIVFLIVVASMNKQLGDYEIFLGGTVIEKGDKIIIEGESNLLEGARLQGEVLVNEDEVFADTTEIVQKDGSFHMEMDHHQYGDAKVVVTFHFDGTQDEAILEHYGEKGEKLEGPFVFLKEGWDGNLKKAAVSLDLPGSEKTDKHPFVAPVWQERPEDYGDPRVWIKVDEITVDEYKDYFHLSGRTNLLEGSRLKGSYAGNWQEKDTFVKPDGTFEMKIKYKYVEKEPFFTIQFHPFSQWDSIRKVYGQNGENLVGDAVERTGSDQFVEVKFDYQYE